MCTTCFSRPPFLMPDSLQSGSATCTSRFVWRLCACVLESWRVGGGRERRRKKEESGEVSRHNEGNLGHHSELSSKVSFFHSGWVSLIVYCHCLDWNFIFSLSLPLSLSPSLSLSPVMWSTRNIDLFLCNITSTPQEPMVCTSPWMKRSEVKHVSQEQSTCW